MPPEATLAAQRSEIPVRRPELTLEPGIPRHWYAGRPFASHFFDALSSTFPDGEAFFVRSVQRFRDRVDDPALARAVQGFAGQEAQHRQQHDAHLELLLGHGYTGLATRNRWMRAALRLMNRHLPGASLRATAALEHLTAILARRLLGDPERWCGPMDPRMARLWQWHALEEAEHKAVAFDVLQRAAPSHARRSIAQAVQSALLALEVLERIAYMLWKDGLLFRRDTWRDGWRFLLGPDGFLRGLGPEWRAWFRRGFHPDDTDDSAIVARGRELLAA